MKQSIPCNVVVHYRRTEDDLVFPGKQAASNLQELEDLLVSIGEDGASVLYIEDIHLKPAVDKYVEVMRRLGYSFRNKDGVYLYYIGGKPYKYEGDAPSAHEGERLEENELRVAVQSHIQSLKGNERFKDLLYIEERYSILVGQHVPIGQTTIFDFIPEEEVTYIPKTVTIGNLTIGDGYIKKEEKL